MMGGRLRILIAAAGLLAAGPALAGGGFRTALAGLQAVAATQTVALTVYARFQTPGSGAGLVALAQAVDVAPAGPGPEDFPASAPTSPAVACYTNGTANCVVQATVGTTVILEATSVDNAAFVSWSGCASQSPGAPGSIGPRCVVPVSAAQIVTANFKPATFRVLAKTYPAETPTFVPPYRGRLQAPTSPPIDCRTGNATYTACEGRVPNDGAALTVTAVPEWGSKVTAWSGCTAVDATTCRTAAITNDFYVTATFGSAFVVVTGQVGGLGTLTAEAGGSVVDAMSCPGDCTASVVQGGSITLTATPGVGQAFLGWTGCANPVGATCQLSSLTANVTVTASFESAVCDSCHAMPPATFPHFGRIDCGTCHPGYTSRTVNATLHANGVAGEFRHPGDTTGRGPTADTDCRLCHPW